MEKVLFKRNEFLAMRHAVPFQVGHVLALHPVDLGEGEEVLADDDP